MLAAVAIASLLCFYNLLVIYPAFTDLLLKYTRYDAIRASHYLSTTLPPLSEPGYTVTALNDSKKNQETFQATPGKFDLIITDNDHA